MLACGDGGLAVPLRLVILLLANVVADGFRVFDRSSGRRDMPCPSIVIGEFPLCMPNFNLSLFLRTDRLESGVRRGLNTWRLMKTTMTTKPKDTTGDHCPTVLALSLMSTLLS